MSIHLLLGILLAFAIAVIVAGRGNKPVMVIGVVQAVFAVLCLIISLL
jgi:hypothetical protein